MALPSAITPDESIALSESLRSPTLILTKVSFIDQHFALGFIHNLFYRTDILAKKKKKLFELSFSWHKRFRVAVALLSNQAAKAKLSPDSLFFSASSIYSEHSSTPVN